MAHNVRDVRSGAARYCAPMPRARLACLAVFAATAAAQADTFDGAFRRSLPDQVESRWTLVPWRASLRAALAEATEAGRPVFLFVNDGEVASGRC